MENIIQLNTFPIKPVLNLLLKDKTTKKNIIWATNNYKIFGESYSEKNQITIEALIGLNPILIQPRIMKTLELQQKRTKTHAEVFTPSWLCNKMNNYCDEEWFGRKNVFNIQGENNTWKTINKKIIFPKNKNWKKYIDSRRLEITCGEAPYLVSRYDAANGVIIPIEDRIGILDRKLRIINENTTEESEWYKWTIRAFESIYGYEYQGDNLLIGRINLLMTFVDYLYFKWKRIPTIKELKKIANIISWNLWQMDGLTGKTPVRKSEEEKFQYTLFDIDIELKKNKELKCKIFDWRATHSILFETLKKEK